MAQECPAKLIKQNCRRCPFGKEGLCDYPFASGADTLRSLTDEKERLETELVQIGSQLLLIEERIVDEILRQAGRRQP